MFCQTFHMFNIFPSLKKVKVGSPKHLISNFGSKPTTKLLNPMILFASFYMSRTVCPSQAISVVFVARFTICHPNPVPIPRSAPPRPDLIRHEAQNKEFADERKMQVMF